MTRSADQVRSRVISQYFKNCPKINHFNGTTISTFTVSALPVSALPVLPVNHSESVILSFGSSLQY